MEYICADRGGDGCPCHLMEAGQCYTCTMVRDGICSCEDAAGWQGVCPYTEWEQQGGKVIKPGRNRLSQFSILSKIPFAQDLFVVQLSVPLGFAEKCQAPGSYIMAEALGWPMPVSVLRCLSHKGIVEFLLKAAGPKSQALLQQDRWTVAGPYRNGLLNLAAAAGTAGACGAGCIAMQPAAFGRMPKAGGPRPKAGAKPPVVVARGTAVAPLVNLLNSPEGFGRIKPASCGIEIYLDDEALPVEWKEEYLQGWPYEKISLREDAQMERIKNIIFESIHNTENPVFLLVSEYYIKNLTKGLEKAEMSRIIMPNPANMCCSEGICGACSHTDEDGVTVRLCKCNMQVRGDY